MTNRLKLFAFFFYGSGDHRDLHSFPTRRSSDLKFVPHTVDPKLSDTRELGAEVSYRFFTTRPAARSEEHTSELQSRFELVCRLLLEKKKSQENREEYKRSIHATT